MKSEFPVESDSTCFQYLHSTKYRGNKDPGIQGHCLWIVRVFMTFPPGMPDIEQVEQTLQVHWSMTTSTAYLDQTTPATNNQPVAHL